MSASLASVKQAKDMTLTRFNAIWIFWVFVGASFFISGIIAWVCLSKGMNVAWSTRYGVWVQVACTR